MKTTDCSVHIPDIVNGSRVGAYQYIVVALCGLVMLIDGFDTQSVSYMAPLIAKEWNLSREMLGPIFSSALAGLMFGYLVLSPLSDRFGHRRLLIGSTLLFSILSLGTAFASNATEMIGLRFLTGLGLGTAIPSAVALTVEYSPKRLRASFVLAIYCGFSLGFVVVGAAAAWLIPLYGWRSLLWVGGLTPLTLCAVLFCFLPESFDYQIRMRGDPGRIWDALRRIDARLPAAAPAAFTTEPEERAGVIKSVFTSGRAVGTLLLWLVFVLNLGEFYALQSWLPTILTNFSYSLKSIAFATRISTIGGIIAAVVIGPAMDRVGPCVTLCIVYLAGAALVASLGFALDQPEWVFSTASFFAGFCVSGGQKSVIALAAIFYPAPIRSKGVGWALGIGRIGAIAGPVLVGILLRWHVSPRNVFFVASAPMLTAGLAMAAMGWLYRPGSVARAAPQSVCTGEQAGSRGRKAGVLAPPPLRDRLKNFEGR